MCPLAQVMWESCTCKLPYEDMTAMQAGLRVATQGLRPEVPASVDPEQARLIRDCWAPVPDQRPSFPEVRTAVEGALESLEPSWGTCACVRAQREGSLSSKCDAVTASCFRHSRVAGYRVQFDKAPLIG